MDCQVLDVRWSNGDSNFTITFMNEVCCKGKLQLCSPQHPLLWKTRTAIKKIRHIHEHWFWKMIVEGIFPLHSPSAKERQIFKLCAMHMVFWHKIYVFSNCETSFFSSNEIKGHSAVPELPAGEHIVKV